MTVTVSPATIFDLAELGGARTRQQWGQVRETFDRGRFYAFHAAGELIVLGGFEPAWFDPTLADLYFNAAPAAARHLLSFLPVARLTIEAQSYRAILTVCRSQAGVLIARRLGFTFQATIEAGEVWGYGRPVWGPEQGIERGAAGAVRPDRVGAAAEPGAAGGTAGDA